MSEIKRGSSNVYYHDTEFMHVVRFFYNNSGVAAAQNARTRWAFLVVGRDELGDAFLNDKAKSNEDRINEIKDKYLPLLQECVNAKDEPAFTLDKTKISEFRTYPSKFKNKWIIRQSTPSKDANKLKSLLKGFGFFDEASVLKNDENMHSNFGYLRLDVKICNQYLYADNIEDEAYALVALPYIYNKKDDVYDVLVLSEHASVSLMPKVLVEYGVFFDGTKNSMYNVDFNLDFHKYLSEQTKIVLDVDAESLDITKRDEHNKDFYPNAATYIRKVNEPRKDVIINVIRDEIQENVRYFQNSSKDKINNEDTKYKSWFQDRASDHSDKVYDFLINIKDGKLNKDTEKAVKDGIILDADTQEYKETLVKEYVYDEILPSGEGSSFVNGYTNIKRLFEHYKAYDPLNLKDSEPRKYIKDSFKVYASGDGCIDPYESGKLKSDSKIGLGLAFGSTGVLAHIVYTCDKIAKNLRHNNYNLVNELVLDVFGFSRGAAEARHFVSSIMKEYDVQTSDTTRKYTLNTSDESKNIFSPFYPEQGGVYTKVEGRYYFNPLRTDIEKITVTKSVGRNKRDVDYYNPYYKKYARKLQIDSVSFRFIGIYDTVAHYGICQANDNKDLNLDFKEAKLGRLVHLTAEDEYRKNFAMTHITESASKKFQEDSKMKEIALPGAHADVGGGYMDKEKSPRYIADENEKLLLKWNKKYEWIKSSPDLFVEAAEDIKEIKRNKKAGFYRIKNLIEDDNLYIYRPKISNKYEYVSLKLMHTEALNSDDNSEKVPFEDISTQYKIDSRNNKFLYKVYKELREDKFEMHGDLHKELRQGYLHHSADLDGIAPIDVNMPSMDNYTNKKVEIYGKRVKYSSTKKQSCFIS